MSGLPDPDRPYPDRPYVVASCAVSVDGYLDDSGPHRLVLSDAADLDRVDEVRAGCDAVCVGAQTVRRDDPRLLVRSTARVAERRARGLEGQPLRVVISGRGDLDPGARLFASGPRPLVYVAGSAVAGAVRARLGAAATVVSPAGAGDRVEPAAVLADLAGRGVRRLLVEGGATTLNGFLAAGLVDELHLVVAPFFVADPAAPRFAGPGPLPHDPEHPMELVYVRRLGDRVLLTYRLPPAARDDRGWLGVAVELARRCPVSASAFSVGAVVVDADGRELARGYSRQEDPYDHAEEVALRRVPPGQSLAAATVYSSLEPCGARSSRPRSCVELILAARVGRVVFAWREPELFAAGGGAERLRAAGVEVVEVPELAAAARAVNAHLVG